MPSGAARGRRRSPFAIFLAVCGVLIAALFAIALADLAHDGGKPEFVRSNDLTSAMTSAAMLGLVAVAYLRITRAGDAAPRVPTAPARTPAKPPAAGENGPAAVRARSGRRRRRRR